MSESVVDDVLSTKTSAIEVCHKHMEKLKERQEFRELLYDVPELAFDIVVG